MEDQILEEIKDVRKLLSKLVGDSSAKPGYSAEAIDKAAKEFKILAAKNGEWIEASEISEIFKGVPYSCGKFIIDHFGFTNYFVRGNTKYLNKKDLLSLKKELTMRKVDLGQYIKLVEDKEKFQQYVDRAKKAKKQKYPFILPPELKDVKAPSYALPPEDKIIDHIAWLKNEFEKNEFSKYIDLYEGSTYAVFKSKYGFNKYYPDNISSKCKKWCTDFNYANYALKEVIRLKKQTLL